MALFTTLYSGSSGNCALILHEGKYLLIDMGKSCRTTLNALRSLGLAVSDCEGILITHELRPCQRVGYFFQALFGASLWLC